MRGYQYPESLAPASEIAVQLGLRRSRPGEWRGQCPACHYAGAAVLSERGGRPVLWCASCADRAALAAALRQAAGGTLPPADRPERLPRATPDASSRIARAKAIWNGAEPITADCPAGRYLTRRRIEHVMGSAALRWRADTPHPAGGRRLALIAAVTAPDGAFAAIQRIFLKPDGNKADCEPQKASLGQVAGGAVRLQDCSSELVVGEGVETSAAAGVTLGKPAWSAISAGNLGKSLILPPEIRSVVIAVDRDDPGERAAREAWGRWTREGRAVQFLKPIARGADAADVLATRGDA